MPEPDETPESTEAVAPEATEAVAPKATETAAPDSARQRIRDAFLRPGSSQFLVATVACLLALAMVMQIRAQSDDELYRTARRADLIQLVDGLAEESRRLESEIAELERTRRELQSGDDSRRVAQEQAQNRLDALAVLAGTAPATGPGVRIVITDPERKVSSAVLLDAIEEMRDAGAEAMEFNDSVRVTASTYVGGSPGRLEVDGVRLPAVVVLEVIGDSHALSEAARFRGGLVSEVTAPQVGGQIEVTPLEAVEIRSVRTPADNVFARPVR